MPLLPHSNNSQRDPNSLQQGSGRQGGTGDRFRSGEFATVISYQTDRYTATIRTERGRTIQGVPRVRTSPGDVAPLSPGSEVLVSYSYGMPVIMGVIALPASNHSGLSSYSASEVEGVGGEGFNQSSIPAGNFRNTTEPQDLTPDDWAVAGPDGALLALLSGGSTLLKSSTLSQIRTHLVNDLVEVISRNYRHITDMGEFTVTNTDGRINMSFRGGTSQRDEAGPDEENWTVHFDLGSEGDILNFEITTPQGNTLFKLHVNAEGRCEIFGINGVDILSGSRTGGGHTEEHTGPSSRFVGGDRSSTTRGSETRIVEGDSSTKTIGDYAVSSGNDHRSQALRDLSLSSGRNMYVAVQGGTSGPAMTFDIESGDWKVDVGSIAAADSGIHFGTYAGDVSVTSELGGDFLFDTALGNIKTRSRTTKVVTGLPDSVVLGGESIGSHVVKWEELQRHLIRLYRALDTHIHSHTGTAIAGGILPVSGTSGPPVIPIGSPLVPNIPSFRSVVVGVSS